MSDSYKGKKFRLFKNEKKRGLIPVIVLFFCLVIFYHNSTKVQEILANKVYNFRFYVSELVDVADRYLTSVKYNFSDDAGQVIFNLRTTNLKLQSENARINSIIQENTELKKKLDLKEAALDNIIIAKVFSIFSNDFVRVALINKGTSHNIAIDDFVFCKEGLIGRVIEVSETWSKVLLIVDANSNIPAKINGVDCMLSGDNSNLLKVTLQNDIIKEEDIAQTSGYGNVFREAIEIGTVKKIGGDYYVVPSVNFNALKFVCIERCQNL